MSDAETITDIVHTLVGTLKALDRDLLISLLHPGMHATLVRDGKILQVNQEEFISRLPWDKKNGELDEVCNNIEVKVYDDIAMAWAPFYTTLNGKMRSRGTNIINFVRVTHPGSGETAEKGKGVWRISGLYDSAVSVDPETPKPW